MKSKETVNKPAKSVLESLLNPAKELDDMNFSFAKSHSSSNGSTNFRTDTVEEERNDLFSKDEYRPSTGNQKLKDSISNPINKRSVRFSTETLGEDKAEFDSALNWSRPQTAPHTNTVDVHKPKFYSRFEAAEFEEMPTKGLDTVLLNSESGSSLWRDSKSDESNNIGNGVKPNYEMNEHNKSKDYNRSAPKQKLTDFMQSSQEELLVSTSEKPKSLMYNEISPTRRRSSNEDLLDFRSRNSTNLIDDLNLGRRSSVPRDISVDRLKADHNRHNKIQIKSGGDPGSDFSFDDKTDYLLKIKHLESERDELIYKLEKIAKRNTEELEMREKSYKFVVMTLMERNNMI